MTKDKINRRVAELMGWTCGRGTVMWKHPFKAGRHEGPPDFCGDPLLWGPVFVADLDAAELLAVQENGEDKEEWAVWVRGLFSATHAELIPAFWLAWTAREEARR